MDRKDQGMIPDLEFIGEWSVASGVTLASFLALLAGVRARLEAGVAPSLPFSLSSAAGRNVIHDVGPAAAAAGLGARDRLLEVDGLEPGLGVQAPELGGLRGEAADQGRGPAAALAGVGLAVAAEGLGTRLELEGRALAEQPRGGRRPQEPAEEAADEDPAEAGVYRLRLGEIRGRQTSG